MAKDTLHILVIDDDPDDRALAVRELKREFRPVALTEVGDAEGFARALSAGGFDVVITDYQLGWSTGLEILGAVKGRYPDCPVIMFTGTGSEEVAVEAMKSGLSDYVNKAPRHDSRLSVAARGAVEKRKQAWALEDAQARLRHSEERFRIAAECASDLIYEWDVQTDHLEWFGDIERLLGLGADGIPRTLGAWATLIHPDDRERVRAAVRRHLETRETYAEEYRIRREDGTYCAWSDRGTALWDERGVPVRCVGAGSDISARREAEAQIRQYADRLRILTEVSRTFTANIADYQTVLQAAVQRTTELIGDLCVIRLVSEDGRWLTPVAIYHRDVERGEFVRTLLESYPRRVNEGLSGDVFQTGAPILLTDLPAEAMREQIRPENRPYVDRFGVAGVVGAPLRVEGRTIGTIFLMRDAGGTPYTANDLALVEDIADRASLAIHNARLFRDAQQANRIKDEFLATVSHELRTPLNSILGWARLLGSGAVEGENVDRAIETIRRNAEAQARLIDELLDVARVVSGKLIVEAQPVELISVVVQAIESARPAAEVKRIELRFAVPETECLVSGDPSRLQQVVWNLLSNAIKFTPDGGRVDVRLARTGSHVEVAVSDTGRGISAELLPYVFDRFRQGDSTLTRLHGGLGLGLAIVRHLVEAHGGTVRAESAGEGQGATLAVRLPALATSSPANRRRASDRAGQGRTELEYPRELRGARILVVDDERDSLDVLALVLEQCGAEVRTAESAAAALAEFERWVPDVLLSDICMAGEDGYSLIRKVRSFPPEAGGRVPAAAVTAYARVEDRVRALAAGFQLHIPKPVEPNDLVVAVTSLVSRDPPVPEG